MNRAHASFEFLEASGEQMDIILVDPRTVMEYEHTKNVERVKSPNKGCLYSWEEPSRRKLYRYAWTLRKRNEIN